MKKSYANILLVIGTIIWGGGFIATDGALDALSPFYIMMIRFMGAAILPCILCFKKLKNLEGYIWRRGLFAGALLFLAFSFQTIGLQYTTPSKNAFLTAVNVVMVPYLLWLYMRKKPNQKEVLASIVCVIGIAFLTLKPDAVGLNIGDMLSIICAFFFATHMIVLERYSRHCDAIVMTALQMLGAGILSTICALLFETPPAQFELSAVGNLAYLIFISTLLAYLLQTFAQRFTTANSASLILSMEALFATLFSFLFLHEELTLYMIFGAALIFCSVIYIEYKPKQHT